VPNANVSANGTNPLCGDQIKITALLEGDKIKEIRFDGHGCAISQSSASMMTAAIKGKAPQDAIKFTNAFKKILGLAEEATEQQDLGDLEALEGVKKYPVRIKCAVLAWNTLMECLSELKNK